MLDTRAFDVVRYLARLPLFSDIGDEALQHLAAGSSLRSIERGQPVFRQGEPCEHFHVVAGGQVKGLSYLSSKLTRWPLTRPSPARCGAWACRDSRRARPR